MSYGPSYPVLFQCAADFVNKILCGTKPGERAIAALHESDFGTTRTRASPGRVRWWWKLT
jgi:hypothetical protein